jgi:hypothetical protein
MAAARKKMVKRIFLKAVLAGPSMCEVIPGTLPRVFGDRISCYYLNYGLKVEVWPGDILGKG